MCKIIIDERCVLCEWCRGRCGALIGDVCWELERDQWVLADEVSRIVGAGGICKSVQGGQGGIAVGKRYGGSK